MSVEHHGAAVEVGPAHRHQHRHQHKKRKRTQDESDGDGVGPRLQGTGAPAAARNHSRRATKLHRYAARGELKKVKKFVRESAEKVGAADKDGSTALHEVGRTCCCSSGRVG